MMKKRKPQSVYQYEPLITPSHWQGEERQLVVRLTQLFDQLFARKQTAASGSVDVSGLVKSVDNVSPDDRGNVNLNAVKSVDGVLPGESGNLYLNSVKSVNGIFPDENGNVSLEEAFEAMHTVGSCYTTTTNVDPATTLGFGTWTLIDKAFQSKTANSNVFTHDTDNVSASSGYIQRSGHSIRIRVIVTPSAALGETNVTLGTLNLETLGVSTLGITNYIQGISDAGNGIAMASIAQATGIITYSDCVTKTSGGSLAAGKEIQFMFTVVITNDHMLDSACDQFVWKRTA